MPLERIVDLLNFFYSIHYGTLVGGGHLMIFKRTHHFPKKLIEDSFKSLFFWDQQDFTKSTLLTPLKLGKSSTYIQRDWNPVGYMGVSHLHMPRM